MKKYLTKSISLIIVVITLISCDSILDQDKTDFGKGPVLAKFTTPVTEVNIIKDVANTPKTYEFEISYAGGKNVPLDKDVTVTIATDPTSEAKEGKEFSLPVKSFTIPAGQNSAKGSLTILTGGLVPFDFKDIVLEITDSSESIAELNTITITVKALGADSLAGDYEILTGSYWRIGVLSNFATSGGGKRTIEALSETLYKHKSYVGGFEGNDWYFTVDANNKVTVLTKDPFTGEPTLLNNVAAMSCVTNPGSFKYAPCGSSSNVVERTNDRKDVIKLTIGYNTTASREFYEVIRRLK